MARNFINLRIKSFVEKADAIKQLKEPRCLKSFRLQTGSVNQFNKSIPNLATFSLPFRKLMQKVSTVLD